MKPKTVCICGTHPRTRGEIPFNDPDKDIWVFNSMIVQEWCPRVTAVFDMHKPSSFNNYEPEYLAWLKGKKDIPFYVIEEDEQNLPGSITYPLESVGQNLLPNLLRGEKNLANMYFTSSPCYAIALAVYLGYERIEFYGIEMESNTEYIYQRDGIALWAGIAAGRGVTFWIPDVCSMLNGPRYGYDDNLGGLTWEEMDQYASTIMPKREEEQNKMKQTRGKMEAIQVELAEAMARGEKQEIMQPTAVRYENSVNEYEQCIANYANLHGQYMVLRNLQMRIGKQMEHAGEGQKVIALNEFMKPRAG